MRQWGLTFLPVWETILIQHFQLHSGFNLDEDYQSVIETLE